MPESLPVVRRIPHTDAQQATLTQQLVIMCNWTPTEAEKLAFELRYWVEHQGKGPPAQDGQAAP